MRGETNRAKPHRSNGFYIQSVIPDTDDSTSEGLFVSSLKVLFASSFECLSSMICTLRGLRSLAPSPSGSSTLATSSL